MSVIFQVLLISLEKYFLALGIGFMGQRLHFLWMLEIQMMAEFRDDSHSCWFMVNERIPLTHTKFLQSANLTIYIT